MAEDAFDIGFGVNELRTELDAATTGEATAAASGITAAGGGPGGNGAVLGGEGGGAGMDVQVEAFRAASEEILAIQQENLALQLENLMAFFEQKSALEAGKAAEDIETATNVENTKAELKEETAAKEVEQTEKQGEVKQEVAKSEVETEKKKKLVITDQQKQAADDFINNLEAVAGANKTFGAAFKAAAITKTTIDTFSAAQGAFNSLASIPVVGPGLGAAAAAAAIAAGFARVNQIRAQSFQEGGFPAGRNALVRLNEGGQEAVLNAQAVNTLGPGAINALNNGVTNQRTITNEISFSPTINVGNGASENLIQVLRQSKDEFARFFQEDVVNRGFLN